MVAVFYSRIHTEGKIGYAIYTVNCYCGQAALVDLNFDTRTDPATGYVALSRVRRADDILILQPSPAVTRIMVIVCGDECVCCDRVCSSKACQNRLSC